MKVITVDLQHKNELNDINDYLVQNDKDILSNISGQNLNSDNNRIVEIAYNNVNNKISNVCFIDGVRDISFFKLMVSNLSDSSTERNKKFISEVTNHVLEELDAETVAIFSKSEVGLYSDLGYEALGECEGLYTYVRNKTVSKKDGGIRI